LTNLKTLLLAAWFLLVVPGHALAQAEIRLCDRPNLNGQCIDLRHGVGDLSRFEFAGRVTSFEIRTGSWLMCDQAGFAGRCRTFERSVGNLKRQDFNNAIVSLRPVRKGSDRKSITLYEEPDFGGRGWTFASDEPDLRRFNLNDRISSVRITEGRWNLCSDINYVRCREVTGSVPRLQDIGLNDRISSLQAVGGGAPTGRAVLYEDAEFRGRSVNVDGPVGDLRTLEFNDRLSSIRLPPGEAWQVCEDVNFGGRCSTVQGDVRSFVPLGLNDRISSLRPERRR
jgi:Beta/Gamma crystallin